MNAILEVQTKFCSFLANTLILLSFLVFVCVKMVAMDCKEITFFFDVFKTISIPMPILIVDHITLLFISIGRGHIH